jgi:hypothetical protein
MGPLEFGNLPEEALLLIDLPPIIYVLEDHPQFGPRFAPLFAAHAAGRLRFAVTTITVAEVLVGPLRAGDDALAQRYRAILASWQPVRSSSILPRVPHDYGLRSAWGRPTPCRPRLHWRSMLRRW